MAAGAMMPDNVELLMKAGRRAYQQFVTDVIEIKTIGRITELQQDFLAIDEAEEIKRRNKAAEKAAKRKK